MFLPNKCRFNNSTPKCVQNLQNLPAKTARPKRVSEKTLLTFASKVKIFHSTHKRKSKKTKTSQPIGRNGPHPVSVFPGCHQEESPFFCPKQLPGAERKVADHGKESARPRTPFRPATDSKVTSEVFKSF